jgi:hypothetical protein
VTAIETPIALLRRLSTEKATGELICAVGDLEVHAYLQQGRVAWATSSGARFAFARELLRRCDVDPTTLQELVEDCRRNRRPLGETLVAWSLASFEDVRESLRLQIRDALATLAEREHAPKLFLERGENYLAYDSTLTFTIEELLDGVRAAPARPSEPPGVLEQLFVDVPEVRWAEVVRDGAVVAAKPKHGSRSRHSAALAAVAFVGDVELAVVRGASATTIGVARTDGTSVWMGLDADVRLGAVFSELGTFVPSPRPSLVPRSSEVVVDAQCDGCVPILGDVLARWSDADVACVVHVDAPTIVHRKGLDASAFATHARTHAPMLSIGETERVGAAHSIALARGCSWSLATPVPDDSGRVLWLAISREASQGLAWALLSATARQIATVECSGGAHG